MIRKIFLGFALLLVICAGAYFRIYLRKPPLEIAYAGNRQVTLWSTTAQVRAPIANVNFGDRLEVLQRFQGQLEVRTMTGVTGWVAEHDLLSADMWQKAKDLEAMTSSLPVQARGHTKVLTNLHLEPGRETPRIRQLNKSSPLDIYERMAVEIPTTPAPGTEQDAASQPAEAKKEDWWLVRSQSPDQGSISGWVLGRFMVLNVPPPLPDYASSAAMRIVGWCELNHVKDAAGNPKPQYLVLGAHGPEGQPCDFTLLRVYTWGVQKQRYETAFVESGVCGKLPLKLSLPGAQGGDTLFAFQNMSSKGNAERSYRMHQTIVRRVKEPGAPSPRKPAPPKPQ